MTMQNNNVRVILEGRMFENFDCVNIKKNIVAVNLDNISNQQLSYIITQYAQFPRNIVSILVAAAYNFGYHGWTELVNELRENVFEELGGGCGEIASEFGPHYSILRKEIHNIFNIDIQSHTSSQATTKFLDEVKNIVQSEPIIAAGGIFALEASAVPELAIITKFVSHLADISNKKLTLNLVNFFNYHINDIEVGHRDRLIKLIEDKLGDSDNLSKFIYGYDGLLKAEENWWLGIYTEAFK
jgi:hypothetical protein